MRNRRVVKLEHKAEKTVTRFNQAVSRLSRKTQSDKLLQLKQYRVDDLFSTLAPLINQHSQALLEVSSKDNLGFHYGIVQAMVSEDPATQALLLKKFNR